MRKVRLRRVPALVGRKEAARILGVSNPNLHLVKGLPPPLGIQRGVEGHEVAHGPLWVRSEIEELAALLTKEKENGRATDEAKARRNRR